ncbi:MAG: hypothetical protein WC906_02250 [Parcubacteria group bacterium]|jgi:hypothetical protein
MRLGEIKQKIDRVISDDKKLTIKNEDLYGGQAQKVLNYREIIDALEAVSMMDWNDIQKNEISEQLFDKYPKDSLSLVLPAEDFNKLNSFVSRVNEKMPIFYSLLSTIIVSQKEQVINIKLPKKIETLEDLSDFNNQISSLFKKFQIDGQFEFKKFDRGTNWYEMYIVGMYTYPYFIACLKIAQEYFKTKAEYFKSMEAKISYETAKLSLEKGKTLEFDDFENRWLKEFIKKEIKTLVEEKIKETNGESNESLQTKLVIATTELIKELGEGTEFHLSLNPPQYTTEQAGQLDINYKKIQLSQKIEDTKKRRIESPKKEK